VRGSKPTTAIIPVRTIASVAPNPTRNQASASPVRGGVLTTVVLPPPAAFCTPVHGSVVLPAASVAPTLSCEPNLGGSEIPTTAAVGFALEPIRKDSGASLTDLQPIGEGSLFLFVFLSLFIFNLVSTPPIGPFPDNGIKIHFSLTSYFFYRGHPAPQVVSSEAKPMGIHLIMLTLIMMRTQVHLILLLRIRLLFFFPMLYLLSLSHCWRRLHNTMISFHVGIVYCYLIIKLNLICYIGSFVFFHSDVSGHWLWNLEEIYSLVIGINEEVPHQTGAQGLECCILFVSGLIKFSHNIILILLLAGSRCYSF